MALDDRERNFEKALARELRAARPGASDCLDAETLAAYHERMLSAEEMIAKKSHVAGCARCQELLASLEATEEIPLGTLQTLDVEGLVKVGGSQAERSTRRVELVALAAAAPSLTSSKVREIPRRSSFWRWTAPAGAIAAGLLVWISIHEWHATKPAQTPIVEMAQNREQTAPLPQTTEPAEPQTATTGTYRASAAGKDEAAAKTKSDLMVGDRAEEGRAKQPLTHRLDHGPSLSQNQIQNQIQNQRSNQPPTKGQEAYEYKAPAAEQRREAQSAAAAAAPERPANTPAPAPSLADKESSKDAAVDVLKSAPIVGGAAVGTFAKEKKVAEADSSAATAEATSGFTLNEKVLIRDGKASTGAFVHSPDPQIFWLIGAGGRIYKTLDAGRTLKQQKSGVRTEILAGSSPHPKVCWLVGRSAVILRTTDGGDHWATLTPPVSADFTFVQATDARRAMISDAAGKVRFSTDDGGASWAAVSKE